MSLKRAFILDTLLTSLDSHEGPLYGVHGPAPGGFAIVISSLQRHDGLSQVAAVGAGHTHLLSRSTDGQWKVELGGFDLELESLPYERDYSARLAGLVDASKLANSCVAVVGLGSVGSPVTIALGRAGVRRLVLWDADRVALSNLTRSGFVVTDIGEHKVSAVARHVVQANPAVQVEAFPRNFDPADDHDWARLDDVDIVVAAASNSVGFGLADRLHRRVPMLFPGLHAGAASGELFVSLGGALPEGPCFSCFRAAAACGESPLTADRERSWNYGGGAGELVAEPGLGADIGHLVSITTAVALQMLAGNVTRVLVPGKQLLLASNRNGALFERAYTTGWFAVPRDLHCPNHAPQEPPDTAALEYLLRSIPREP